MTLRRAAALVWAAPVSLPAAGLALAVRATGGQWRWHAGALEAHGGALARWVGARGGYSAITLGHVILATHADELARHHVHERVHVAQYERYGALMLLLYPGASLWAALRGRRGYWDNAFEREARLLTAKAARTKPPKHPTATTPTPTR
jgi:hypothetical protein